MRVLKAPERNETIKNGRPANASGNSINNIGAARISKSGGTDTIAVLLAT
jgi:hypothetical protein